MTLAWAFSTNAPQQIKSTPNPFFRRVEMRVFRVVDGNPRQYAELMSVLPTNQ